MKLNHEEKKHLARRLMNKLERKTSNQIRIPTFPRGTMISRLFTSANWMNRRMSRAGIHTTPVKLSEEQTPVVLSSTKDPAVPDEVIGFMTKDQITALDK